MTGPAGEYAEVRERIAQAIYGYSRMGPAPHAYYEMADRVLDALGLERVGWLGGKRAPLMHSHGTHRVDRHAPDDCTPLYTVGTARSPE